MSSYYKQTNTAAPAAVGAAVAAVVESLLSVGRSPRKKPAFDAELQAELGRPPSDYLEPVTAADAAAAVAGTAGGDPDSVVDVAAVAVGASATSARFAD